MSSLIAFEWAFMVTEMLIDYAYFETDGVMDL